MLSPQIPSWGSGYLKRWSWGTPRAAYAFEAGVSGLFLGKNAPNIKTQTPNEKAFLNM